MDKDQTVAAVSSFYLFLTALGTKFPLASGTGGSSVGNGGRPVWGPDE